VGSPPIVQETRLVPSKDFVKIYANHAHFGMSTVWDMRVSLGEVSQVENNEIVVDQRAIVTMPLAVAKILAMGIVANLVQYEKQTGKTVEIPPGVSFSQPKANLPHDHDEK
jgi:hypothetical protein